MGQCASRKSVGAYTSTAGHPGRPMAAPDMNSHFKRHHGYTDDNQNQDDNNKDHTRRSFTRGVRTSFGFKRPSSAIPTPRDSSNNKQQIHPVDNNGNDDSLDSPDSEHVSGRTTPRLAPPKKEANATRLNRFGFRNSTNVNRPRPATATGITTAEYKNNNVEKEKPKKTVSIAPSVPKSKLTNKTTVNSKIKSSSKVTSPSQPTAPTKYTFHTTQLPRPQLPVRVVESKNAKTAANINRKVSSASQRSDEAAFSSKEGSVTEDSGVGSHTSGTNSNFAGDSDTLHGVELMDSSPTFGARRKPARTRNLELVVAGNNFDIRDLDDSTEDGVVTEVAVIPLPRLPSVFANNSSDARSTSSSVFGNVSTGMVRERTLEFERQIDKNRRKISVTSSEGCSEDYGEEEKSFRDRSSNEKAGQAISRLYSSTKPYRESHSRKPKHSDKDSSPTSSDDQDWELGGEAMAEVCSIGFSSSDESKEKEISPLLLRPSFIKPNHSEQMSSSCTGAIPKDNSRSVLHRDETDRPGESLRHSLTKPNIPSESSYHKNSSSSALPKDNLRSVLLTIEEPKYTSLSQICPPRPLTSSMMTSSSSMSSSTSSAAKDYLKSSLFMMDDDTKNPIEFRSMTNSTLTNSASSTPKDNLKSVLLSIEDPKFAAVAASSSGNLLDDETSPVDSLISSYTESEEIIAKNKAKTSKSSTDSKDVNEKSPLSPESPGTPTNASLSLSEGRDFLIDDEIADQPGLMFNETVPAINSVDRMRNEASHNLSMFSDISMDRVSSEHHNISDSVATLVDSTPKLSRKNLRSCEGSPAFARAKNPLLSRTASVDTLSPCESIASDDLMMDFDHSQSSGIEDSTDRLHLNESGALHSLDEETLRSELENQDAVVARQWSSLLGTHSNKDSPPYSVVRTNNFLRSRTTTPSSVPDSPRSLDRAGLRNSLTSTNSPLLRSARTTHGSPAAYDSDDSSRLERLSHGSMVNDIVGIKTMLHKLKRVLQETDEDNLMRTEPLNPFENQSLKNGLYNGLNNEQSDLDSVDSMDLTSSPALEMTELRRQIEFLQSQLDDRDRTVHQLQNQISKYNLDKHQREGDRDLETCNAATQTDRVRPLSAGPSLLQTLPPDGGMGPLVSANETTRRSRPQSMVENSRTPPLKLWRKPGEPPPPSRLQPSSLPRRTRSRSRPTAAP